MDVPVTILSPQQAVQLSPLVLAFMGDTVYDLLVREWLLTHALGNVQALHRQAVGLVNASAQATAARAALEQLSEEEAAIFRRGRNTQSTPPKNADPGDYSQATGWEALFGYLYITGRQTRLRELFAIVIAIHEPTQKQHTKTRG